MKRKHPESDLQSQVATLLKAYMGEFEKIHRVKLSAT